MPLSHGEITGFLRSVHPYDALPPETLDQIANQVEGIESVSPTIDLSTETVLDVRVPEEREERPLTAGKLSEIEVSEVRDRADEVPAGPLLVACAHGTRSAEVVRWLAHRGVQARYIGGGVSWRARALRPEA